MELESGRFYQKAAARSQDASIRQLLDDLANEEQAHITQSEELTTKNLPENVREQEAESERRLFLLQIVQPGLAGLMDGSVSTLAPLFAAAVATQKSWDAFLVGMAASVGAGISMGFAEALSDDGSLTGRGHPWLRGGICGLMTALGGVGHTLPFLFPNFRTAMMISAIVVLIELSIISWVRHRYMDTPVFSATMQVMLGGALVFIAGLLIGSARKVLPSVGAGFVTRPRLSRIAQNETASSGSAFVQQNNLSYRHSVGNVSSYRASIR